MTIDMREPCTCGCSTGEIEVKSGQDVVRCSDCGAWCYNRPKAESGKATRSVSTRSDIKPKKRAKVLLRANNACEVCRRTGVILHVGHVVSVAEGRKVGLSDVELNSAENLIAMCEECNLGLGKETIPIKNYVAILMARFKEADSK